MYVSFFSTVKTDFIFLTFLRCVFSNVYSRSLDQIRNSHIGCISLTFLYCVFSNVLSCLTFLHCAFSMTRSVLMPWPWLQYLNSLKAHRSSPRPRQEVMNGLSTKTKEDFPKTHQKAGNKTHQGLCISNGHCPLLLKAKRPQRKDNERQCLSVM